MLQLFASSFVFGFFMVVLAILLIGATIWILGGGEFDEKWPAIITLVLAGLCVWGFIHQQTHLVIKPNESAVIISKLTGEQIGPIQYTGIAERKPLWAVKVYKYPAQENYQWCPTMTPSIENGVGIVADLCFVFDASKVDWASEFLRYNGDADDVLAKWQKELQPLVAIAFSQYTAMDLTNHRDQVMTSVDLNTYEWFIQHNISILDIGLVTWDFSSEDMSSAWDQTQLSSTKITIAENDKKAAEIQTEIALLKAQACKNAGMTTETGCIRFLELTWLNNLPEVPSNLVISLGGTTPSVAFPVTANP